MSRRRTRSEVFSSESVAPTQRKERGRRKSPLTSLPAELRDILEREVERFKRPQEEQDERLARTEERLMGRRLSPKERLQARVNAVFRHFEVRRVLLRESFSSPQVANLLGVSEQTVHGRRERGTLIAMQDNGFWRYPAWQFDAEGPNGTVSGLPEVIDALAPQGTFASIRWLSTPLDHFEGLSPVDAMKQGRLPDVLYEAGRIGFEANHANPAPAAAAGHLAP